MLALYLSVLDDRNFEEDFTEVYNTYKRLVYHTAYKIMDDSYLAEDVLQEVFLYVAKNFSKIHRENCHELAAYLVVVVEAVHMICFANNEKNCWKMSQTNQMPLRCRMMQQLAPITLNV